MLVDNKHFIIGHMFVNMYFFTQNDSTNNFLKVGTHHAEHPALGIKIYRYRSTQILHLVKKWPVFNDQCSTSIYKEIKISSLFFSWNTSNYFLSTFLSIILVGTGRYSFTIFFTSHIRKLEHRIECGI
jgi:hypothetical protein